MKTPKPTPIACVLSVIGAEIAAAHQLLIDFEHANCQIATNTIALNSDIQGFDLALQILSDLEHLAKALSQQLSAETALSYSLPISEIRLERVRVKLSKNQLSEADPQGSVPTVDLF